MADIAQLGIEIDTRKLKSGEKDLAAFASGASDVTKATDIAKGAIVGMVAAAAGVMTLSKSIDTLVSFSREMAALTAVTKASESQMKALSKQAQTLGAVTAYGANDAAAAQKFLAQAGLSVNEVISATPSVLQLAQAGMLDLGTAAELATDIMSQMGLGVQDLNRINDVLVQTANSATTDVSQLAEAFSYAGPIAKDFGLSLETTSAALGVISSAGIKASRAGTGFVGFLASANALTPQAEKRLLRYGVTFDQLNVQQRGLIPVLQTLSDANISASDAIEIFGRESASSTMALVSHVSTLKQYTSELRSSQGVAAEAASIMSNDLGSAFSSFSSSIDGIIIKLGEDQGLTAELKRIIDTASGVINVFSGMETEFASSAGYGDEFLVTVRGVADAIEALSIVFAGRLIGSMLTSKTAMSALSGVVSIYSAATSGATVVTDAHGMAISRTSALANTGKVAIGGLNTVMTAMGGPLGIVTLAASALLAWNNYADEAATKARSLADAIDISAASLANMTQKQLAANAVNVDRAMLSQKEAVSDLKSEVESLQETVDRQIAGAALLGNATATNTYEMDQLKIKAAELETAENDLNLLRQKSLALLESLVGNGRENYVMLNNQSSATGVLIGFQKELNKVLGQQPKTTGAPSLIVSDGAPAKPAVAPVSSIKSTATNKLEDQKKAAAEYLTEVSRFNATEAQQIKNWQADQLNQLEAFHKAGVVSESNFAFAKQAIINEANKRTEALAKQQREKAAQAMNSASSGVDVSGGLTSLKSMYDQRLITEQQYNQQSAILKQQWQSKYAEVDNWLVTELATYKQLLADKTISEQQYNTASNQLQLQWAQKRREVLLAQRTSEQTEMQTWLANIKANMTSSTGLMTETFNSFTTNIASGLTNAIIQADSFGDAMRNAAASFAQSMIQAIIQVMAQKAVMWALEKSLGAATNAAYVGMVAGQAGAGVQLAGINAYASTAAIPIVGPAAAPAAMATAIGATAPLATAAVASAASSISGMAHDGISSVPSEGTWLLNKGERVYTNDSAKQLDQMYQNSQQSSGGNVTVNVSLQETSDASKQGTTSQTTGDDGSVQINVFVADIRSEGSMAQVLERTYGLSRMGA
jgi:TP901 family phage tail tape measure protein